MPYGRGYTGGSELGDLLSGFLGGYRAGDEMRAQRAAEALAREREARYAEEAAFNREQALWQRGQAERQFAAGDAERALRGILPDTAPVDRTATVGARMGPSAEIETTPLNDTGTVTDRATVPGQFMESRYRDTGTGYVIDRSIADPQVVAQRQRFEGDQRAAQANRAISKLLGPDAGDLTGFVGTDVTPDAQLRLGQANVDRERSMRALSTLAGRYGVDVSGLDDPTVLAGELDRRGDIWQAGQEAQIRARYTPSTFEFIRDPNSGAVTAVNTRNPDDKRVVSAGFTVDASDPMLGYDPQAYVKATVDERKNAGWGQRAVGGIDYLQSHQMPADMQAILARSLGKGGKGVVGALASYAKRAGAGSEAQRYWNALQQAGQGILRKDTGAQINDDELPLVIDLIGIAPGENDPAVRAQKFEAADNALLELAIGAGRAVTNPAASQFRDAVRGLMDPGEYAVRRMQQYEVAGYTDPDEIDRMVREDIRRRFGNRGGR